MRARQAAIEALPFLVVAALVMGPLFLPGFVLTMDMVFTPVLRAPDHMDNTFVFYWVLHVLNFVVPADVLQKVLLVLAFTLSGWGVYRLLHVLHNDERWQWRTARYAGGLFYAVNPFVYDRLMAGQYGVLLGYAVMPWFAGACIELFSRPTLGTALRAAAWAIAMSIVSIHSIGFAVIVACGLLWLYAPRTKNMHDMWRYSAASLGIFVVASSYWLVPAFVGQGRIADSLQTFSVSQRQAFATVDTNGESAFGAVLGLQGFWQDTRGLYVLPIDFTPQWGLVRLVVLAAVGAGAAYAWRHRRREAIFFGGMSVLAIALALDVGGELLVKVVPFFAGYREPQKFVALLALSYGYFMAWGVYVCVQRIGRRPWLAASTIGGMVLLIAAYTSPLLWGAAGQLKASTYPSDWRAVNALLTSSAGSSRVLYLPWHLYMGYDFAGRIIASPAPAYFDTPMIVGNDPELTGVTPQFPDATKQTIQQLILPAVAKGRDISGQLRALNISYILLAKESDYQQYAYLDSHRELTLVMQTDHFKLYKLNKEKK